MSKKYFVISDIHGHFDEMIVALKEAQYDSKNMLHHLIVIGDMFDRGTQSKEVLEYLYSLNIKGLATVILGNHDNFLIELFDRKYQNALFNIRHNGTYMTLISLLGKNFESEFKIDEIRSKLIEKYSYLEDWLKSLPTYLELGDYIFVHGGINGKNDNWRKSMIHDFIWSRQINLEPVKGKIMVVGHHRTATIRYPGVNYKSLFIQKPEAFKILYRKNKIFLDSFVEISKFINVLVLQIE